MTFAAKLNYAQARHSKVNQLLRTDLWRCFTCEENAAFLSLLTAILEQQLVIWSVLSGV